MMRLEQFGQSIQMLAKAIAVVIITSLACSSAAFALSVPNVATMLENLSKSTRELTALVTAIAYVLGMFFVVKGIVALKNYGESRTSGSHGEGIKSGLTYIIVGGALLYLPSTVQTGLTTFWDVPTPYAYEQETSSPFGDLITACFMIVQLIGVISFIRGLIMLTHIGGQGGHHQSSFGKALTHMIAGIFLINLYQFLQVVFNTLALGEI